jgi:hypothetical protein
LLFLSVKLLMSRQEGSSTMIEVTAEGHCGGCNSLLQSMYENLNGVCNACIREEDEKNV